MSYPVGRSYIEMRILLGMSVLMLGLHAWMFPLWGYAEGLNFPRWLLSLLFGMLMLVWAWHGWLHGHSGWISWAPVETRQSLDNSSLLEDGEAGTGWLWSGADGSLAEPVYHVHVACRLNGCMLLRLRLGSTPNRRVWIWLEQRAQPDRWLALRRALSVKHAS